MHQTKIELVDEYTWINLIRIYVYYYRFIALYLSGVFSTWRYWDATKLGRSDFKLKLLSLLYYTAIACVQPSLLKTRVRVETSKRKLRYSHKLVIGVEIISASFITLQAREVNNGSVFKTLYPRKYSLCAITRLWSPRRITSCYFSFWTAAVLCAQSYSRHNSDFTPKRSRWIW